MRPGAGLVLLFALVAGCSSSSAPKASLDPLEGGDAGGSGGVAGQGAGAGTGTGAGAGAGGGTGGSATASDACAGHTENILVLKGGPVASSVGKSGAWNAQGEGWQTGFRLSFEGGSDYASIEVTARPTNGIVTAGQYSTDAPSKADAMHLGLDVGCGVQGSLTIDGIAWDGDRLNEVSASFAGHCVGGGPVTGCVHYVRDGWTGGTPAAAPGWPPLAGVGRAEPCTTGGNVAYLFGDDDDYIHAGPDLVTSGKWTSDLTQTDDYLTLHIEPAGDQHGGWWDLDFSTKELGKPLAPGVYEMAERAPFASPQHPGLDVSGDGRGCNTLGGRFQIHDVSFSGAGTLSSFTASFEQHCELGSPAVRGCVHYAAP